MKAMEAQMNEIMRTQHLILSAMEGNSISKDGGLVGEIRHIEIQINEMKKSVNERIDDVEERADRAELFIAKINWTIFLVVSVCSSAAALLGLVIAYLALKK